MMDRHLIFPLGWEHRKRKDDWDADPSLKGCVCHRDSSKSISNFFLLSTTPRGTLLTACTRCVRCLHYNVPSPLLAHRKPVPIQGTSVRLDTPEAIAAWIAERKKRFPTAQNVAEKERKRREAAEIVRAGAHQALEELREVLQRRSSPRVWKPSRLLLLLLVWALVRSVEAPGSSWEWESRRSRS